ncbi:hypothetical protein Tco_0735031 [Tanacetum coccineum]
MGCCLTSWFSKKQTALALSTTKAEYVSAKKACQQALRMTQALIDYGIRLDDIPIMCDNKGAIDLKRPKPLKDKNQRAFVRGSWSDSGERRYVKKIDEKAKTETCLLAHASNEYSQNSKAYIILNKHTRKVKESLNVTFDETPPPPLVDDDLDEEEAIREIKKKNLENDIDDETLEIDEIVNIKESRNHPLENFIGNLNQRILRKSCLGNPELENESYVLYDRIMTPFAAQLERKPRSDHGTRRGRHSTSSSSAFDQPSSSHLNDDDDDGNDEGTSRASTPSPIRYVNSLTNQVPQVFQNPPNIDPHLEPFYTRQTEIINRQVQLRDEQRGGVRSIGKSLRRLWRNMKK